MTIRRARGAFRSAIVDLGVDHARSNNGQPNITSQKIQRETERRAASCRRVRSATETSARGGGGCFAALSMKTLSAGAYSKTFARHNIPVTGLTATTHDSPGHYPPFHAISSYLAPAPLLPSLLAVIRFVSLLWAPLFDLSPNELRARASGPPFD